MGTTQTLAFGLDFIEELVSYLEKKYSFQNKDLSRVAIVFGGKRPSLFMKRELSRRIKGSFYPPRFFSIDEFIAYTGRKAESFTSGVDLDQCYLLYQLAKRHAPQILKGRETFSQFLPWTREILSFIDHLDLECVADERLRNIEANAQIGYAVPPDINLLLEHIVILRQMYHRYMRESKNFSRGFLYRFVSEAVSKIEFPEFDEIVFCNFFYLHHSEGQLMKNLYDRGLGSLIFQGDESRWPTLKRTAAIFGETIREQPFIAPAQFNLKLYSAFDGHSQVATVREILKGVDRLDRTVIVLPDPDNIIPLLSEIDPLVKEYNISMGYPLKRSSLYSLIDFIFKAQSSRDDGAYYTRDLLRVLRHPLVKNLDFGLEGSPAATRILVHKIEEMLSGLTPGALSGQLFVTPSELVALDELYLQAEQTLNGMGVSVSRLELKNCLEQILEIIFTHWEGIESLADFAVCLDQVMDLMLKRSFLRAYPLNLKIAEKILTLKEQLQTVAFRDEHFEQAEIFKIFTAQMEREIVAFTGSPLKGLQILGLFETRSLNFDNVIVLNANEGVLPRLNVYEPLIPREVMISLDLDRLENEEEIQRYQFMRLISAAKQVHLVYEENAKNEKSRFVEELVWEEQKKKGSLAAVPVVFPSFRVKVSVRQQKIIKTPQMVEFLKKHRYSASSINTYLRSPIEFYFSYVLGLREKEDLLDEPENRQVGTFVHGLLEEVFKIFIGTKPVLDDKFRAHFHRVRDRRFAEVFGKGRASDAFLLKKVIDMRMDRFFEAENRRAKDGIAEVLYIEKKFEDQILLSCGTINFAYRVDRVDRMSDGTIMILDYKTGSHDPMPKKIMEIEMMDLSRESIRDKVISFQIPLYFNYLDKTFRDQPVGAAYYNLRTLQIDKFPDHKMNFERERINAAFLRPLDFIMSEILDIDTPFMD